MKFIQSRETISADLKLNLCVFTCDYENILELLYCEKVTLILVDTSNTFWSVITIHEKQIFIQHLNETINEIRAIILLIVSVMPGHMSNNIWILVYKSFKKVSWKFHETFKHKIFRETG